MANKLGFYLHSFEIGPYKENLFRDIQEIRPPVILVHAWNQVDQLRRLSPDSLIIGRMEYFGPEKRPIQDVYPSWLRDPDPRARGRDFAEHILRDNFEMAQRRENGRLLVDAWMSLNEPIPGPASDQYRIDPLGIETQLHAYDLFQAGFRERLMEHDIEAVAFNFGADNFTSSEDYARFFPETLAGHLYLGFHEYGWPALSTTIDPTTKSGAGSYRPIVTGLSERFGKSYQAVITELGLTLMHKYPNRGDLGDLDQGWLVTPPPELGARTLTQQDYWQSLAWYNAYLNGDGFARGACLFEVGHAGRWETFRHYGKDHDGAEITILDRVRQLSQQPEGAAFEIALPAPDHVKLRGRVENPAGGPVPGAMVRLVGRLEELGDDPRAAVNLPGAVTWSRALVAPAGGSLWSFWRKYVAREVAAITWEEFRVGAPRHNPSLYWTDDVFVAGEMYFLPENRSEPGDPPIAPPITWDRRLTAFSGSRWKCWRRHVQGKVVGMGWQQFRRAVMEANPSLESGEGEFEATQEYLLPRHVGASEYYRTTFTPASGRFTFDHLRPGVYRLEIVAPDYRRLEQALVVTADQAVILTLEPLAISIAPSGLEAAADQWVRVVGRHFVVGGQSMRFMGANLRGLVHYGSDPVQNAKADDQLAAVHEMGGRVVRVFLPNVKASPEETRARLAALISTMKARFPDMYLIVALSNLYSDVEFRVPGDDAFYNFRPQGESRDLLGPDWFRDGFRRNYLPFVEATVEAFKNESTIMAYNIGNELKVQDDPELLIRFMHTVARRIREIDSRHLVTTGMISTRHAFMAGRQDLRRRLYDTDLLHFITNHAYHDLGNQTPSIEDDSDLAAALGKPLLIEEAGFVASDDRSELYGREVNDLLGRGAGGYMPWGLMAGTFDTGDGDRQLGIDRIWHGVDWDRLIGLFRDWSGRLAAESVGIADPKPTTRPAGPQPGSKPGPTGPAPAPSDFSPGQRVFAIAGVRLRQPAGLKGDIRFQTPKRMPVTVQGAFEVKDGLRWWPVQVVTDAGATLDGWMAQTAPTGSVLLFAT